MAVCPGLTSVPKAPSTRLRKVDLPQPESAATPIITGACSGLLSASRMGTMSSVQAWVEYSVMPSTSRVLAASSGEGYTRPVGTLLAAPCSATSALPA
eukprot:3916211-Pyramimonas_sp.AAC.1